MKINVARARAADVRAACSSFVEIASKRGRSPCSDRLIRTRRIFNARFILHARDRTFEGPPVEYALLGRISTKSAGGMSEYITADIVPLRVAANTCLYFRRRGSFIHLCNLLLAVNMSVNRSNQQIIGDRSDISLQTR